MVPFDIKRIKNAGFELPDCMRTEIWVSPELTADVVVSVGKCWADGETS